MKFGKHELSSILLSLLLVQVKAESVEVDPQGYIAYCPCMGEN